jgi:hypothetical protein
MREWEKIIQKMAGKFPPFQVAKQLLTAHCSLLTISLPQTS